MSIRLNINSMCHTKHLCFNLNFLLISELLFTFLYIIFQNKVKSLEIDIGKIIMKTNFRLIFRKK